MFSIENYIKELIISKVEKFVKNINPEELKNQFKVSLWEGDVVFQNLELKLDVLDEELQIPFTFISGFIKYLKIQIPWTKIGNEPIYLTINDSELVVKLKDPSTYIPPTAKPKSKSSSEADESISHGYIASLIAKIVNNISVICNNVSIKFLEDDIVFSMNIPHLSVYSADNKWRRAFTDVSSASNVVSRKLINIIDLTICLDKRNSLGKIEYVQEPFLYKCSMELRIFRMYNVSSPEKSSIMRIDLQTKALNINISSQQLGMLVRLMELILALKSGRLYESNRAQTLNAANNEGTTNSNDESWMLWMWNNMVPTIMTSDVQNEDVETNSKKILEFGIYIENAQLALKSQELISDPIIPSAKKAILKPLLELNINEMYSVTIICGNRYFNVKGGSNSIEIKALDDCSCGSKTTESTILKAGKNDSKNSYLIDSYFDKKTSTQNKYREMFNNYFEKNTEELMLSKDSISFDILHSVEIPDDHGSSDLGSDLEYSNFSEYYTIRVFGNKINFYLTADAIHRIEKLVQYYHECEFSTYGKEEKIPQKSQLSPATADDYEVLINETPQRNIIVKMKNSKIHIKEWNHEKSQRNSRKILRQSSLQENMSRISTEFTVNLGDFKLNIESPLYKNRLVFTACQLPDNIENELFKKCFIKINTSVKNVIVDIRDNSVKKICEILKVSSVQKNLIYPSLWEEYDLKQNTVDIELNGLSFMMNPAQFYVFYYTLQSILQRIPPNCEISNELVRHFDNSELVVLQLTSRILKFKYSKLAKWSLMEFIISDLIGMAWKRGSKSIVLNIPDNQKKMPQFSSKNKDSTDAIVKLCIQIPQDGVTEEEALTVIALDTSEGCISLDPLFREFLSFKIVKEVKLCDSNEYKRTLSTSTKPLLNELSNVQESSQHSSSEYQDTLCPSVQTVKNESKASSFKNIRSYIINICIRPLSIYYSTSILESFKASDSIRENLMSNGCDAIILKSPSFLFHSVKSKNLTKCISDHFPVNLPNVLWGNDKSLTWNLELTNFNASIVSNKKNSCLIQNASMKVSVADESQLDKEELYSGNMLIEIFPLYMDIHTSNLELLNLALKDVLSFTICGANSDDEKLDESTIEDPIRSALDIKDFLGLPTGSTITKTSLHDHQSKKKPSNVNFYIQTICSKICLTFNADHLKVPKKFVTEIDEILFSLHQQEFFQLKCKITAISGNHFHFDKSTGEWMKNLNLGFNIQSDKTISDTVTRFLDVTVTKADTMNVHSKWNVEMKKNAQLILNNVSEINIILQSFDLIISDEVSDYVKLSRLFEGQTQETNKSFISYAGSDLPLFHMNCNGFRIFIPNLERQTYPNVLILKVNSVQLTPNAVNNLIRSQIIRPDIVNKASNLGILDLVGSKIEDRQYQLLVKGCSLTSSNWNDITDIICEKNVENYDNPATVWNNLENFKIFPNFKCNTIFKESSFSFIYAPCIKFKEVVIAGAAIEINCIENMNIVLSLEQIMLFIDLSRKLKAIGSALEVNECNTVNSKETDSKNIPMRVTKTKRFFDKKSVDDSGVASTISNSYLPRKRKMFRRKTSVVSKDRSGLIPYEFTFTSSKFNFNFTMLETNFNFLLDTPNLYITRNGNDQSFNLSMHDLRVDRGAENLFVTRHGNINSLSGLTNSLCRIKIIEKSLRNTELSIEIGRSINLKISSDIIEELFELSKKLKAHAIQGESSGLSQNQELIQKARKFDTVKLITNNFKVVNFKTDQILVDWLCGKCQFAFGLQNVKGKIKLFDRPEKLESNIEISHITAKSGNDIFIHPLSVEGKLKITQEYWKKDPLVYFNVVVNYIKLDLWPSLFSQLQLLLDTFQSLSENMNSKKVSKFQIEKSTLKDSFDTAIDKIQLYAEEAKMKQKIDVEHFSDDLRSGIYTFVEVISPFQELPLPYQIHYQESGIICWRYPLPRALHKIKIFPAPLQTSSQIRLDCKIEYYSQLKSQFEELIALNLNENETKLLDMDENTVFAEVWRIKFKVNIKRDSEDEDENDDSIEDELNYLQMHPKVLLACLRIDSYYKSSAVPMISSLMKISQFELNVFNQDLSDNNLQSCSKYEIFQLIAESIQVFGQHYDEYLNHFVIEGALSADIKDYGCKNLIPFVKKFYLKSSVDVNYSDMNISLILSRIKVAYSPSIGHSLLSNFILWKNIIHGIEKAMSQYTIINQTGCTISINQAEIEEMIQVSPNSSKQYDFFTDKEPRNIQISVYLKNETWSEKVGPININQEGIQYIKSEDHQYLIVTVKNTTNCKRTITVDGQVYVRNMTKELFDLQYKRYDKDITSNDKCEIQEIDLNEYGSRSFYGPCEYDSQQTIRLHLKKCEKRLFSGEIPLREIVANNKPWLVKVPLNSSNFICYWVRIIRQLVNDEVCRVLILICPAFVAKSLFPCDIILTEEETQNHYSIKGCGQITEVEMKGTHENEHKLLLPGNYLQQDNKSPALVTLSYNLVNKSTFFKIPDEFSDISRALEKLDEKKQHQQWPCPCDDDYQVERDFTMNESVTALHELSSYEPEGLCCSLMLTLIPSCLLVNSTGVKIRITNYSTSQQCFIESNQLTVPFHIENAFMIAVKLNDEWIDSVPILLNDTARKKFTSHYELPVEGSSFVNIHHNVDTVQFSVTSKSSGKRRTIMINTALVICNYSSYELGVIPFCVDSNEKVDAWKRNEFPTKCYVRLHKNQNDSALKMGNPISLYSNIARYKGVRKHGTTYTSFLMICNALEEGEFSCPIKVQSILRKCFNIHYDGQSRSISISILKHEDQFFVSVYNDSKPILNIINKTDFNLYVAQTDIKHQSLKNIAPHRETADDRFTWHQVVNSKQNVFYTPPVFNEYFPEIASHDYGLIFACVCGDGTIRWSIPVKIDETKKIIINVPMFGDLKLQIDMKKITTEIFINYIDSGDSTSDNLCDNQKGFETSMSSDSHKNFVKRKNKSNILNLSMYFEGVNIMITKDDVGKRLDLISLSVDDILTKYSKTTRTLKVNFSKVQVDNELFSTGNFDFPVLLCNKDIPKVQNEKLILPILSTWNVYEIIQRHSATTEKFSIDIDFYELDNNIKNVSINLLPIRIYIEDGIIHTFLELAEECMPSNGKKSESSSVHLSGDLVLVPKTIINQSLQLSEPVRLHMFRLNALHVLLSVHTCKHLYIALDHSPLDFNVYEKNNVYTVPIKFGNNFGMHYISSAIFGAGWVVGSLEILGSPSGLARSFTSGFKDFVSMPIQGIFNGPFGFLVGLTQGSVSLFRNVTTGTLNSVTKLANSLARNLDNLTLDNEHIYLKTDTLRRSRPQGFTDGLQLGLTGFGINILGAIGGLSRHPLQAKNVVDVFTGVGKGLIGVVTKPISGIAELVAFMGSGVLQSVGYNVLPMPLNQEAKHELSVPIIEKIIKRQLPQFITDPIVMSCRATYVDKNDLKHSFLILNTKCLIIVDLEKDFVINVLLLENITPVVHKTTSTPDNLFVFKLKSKKPSIPEDDSIEKYHVSKRTVLYIKQLTNQHFTENLSSYNEDHDADSDELNDLETQSTTKNNDKISFYINNASGKFLMNYILLIKYHTSSKENTFSLFENIKT